MSEDERTLWCGNLSENVTEELLYELFLQAGPLEEVRIPRNNEKRQRSYAFITYVHACSVEYAMRIFEGTSLFKRPLTLKFRNGSNSSAAAASPKENFKYPIGDSKLQEDEGVHSQDAAHRNMSFNDSVGSFSQNPSENNSFQLNGSDGTNSGLFPNDILSTMAMALGSNSYTPELLMQLGQQMLGAELPAYEDNNQHKDNYRTKMNHHDRHNRNPYARDERDDRVRNRNHDRHRNHDRDRKRHENDGRRSGHDRNHDYRRKR